MVRQSHHFIAQILQLIAGGGMGLCLASFTHHFGTRSADRMPGESRWPQCFYCLKPLSWQESFPLFSWLLRPDVLSLPCPCGKRGGLWAQPTVEILAFLLGMLAVYAVDWSIMAVPLSLGMSLVVAIAFVDLQFGIIPDGLNLLLAALGIWWDLQSGRDMYEAMLVSGGLLAVGLFCALVYSRLRKREMLGLGDVKFFAAAGFWLPLETAPWFLAIAGGFGVLLGMLWKRGGGGKEFPFAPALCLSLVLCTFYPLVKSLVKIPFLP